MSAGSIAVVTDSSADLGPLAAQNKIVVVPLRVRFGLNEYDDGSDLSAADFYAKLKAERDVPSTAQPSPASFQETYRRLLADGAPHILSLHLSAKLSGTFNAARMAAAEVAPERITTVDTGTVSSGLGLLALHARRRIADGATFEAAQALVAELIHRLWLYATVPSLTYLARGGRIGRLRGLIGNALKIVPVLTLTDGEVKEYAKVRTFGRAVDAIVDAAKSRLARPGAGLSAGCGLRCAVIHAVAPELAESIARRLSDVVDGAEMMICSVGPTVGTHAGPGAIGVFCLA
ncbi:MAG: DegV family protein [Candidatus Eremiobacteraeota bacterium]|nr:DegV family protein [Candidatus Eremiobacteraeota bacterium]MBC5826485.1 DegV family protein [Candidatus Eremiobacteraeota bacterium]